MLNRFGFSPLATRGLMLALLVVSLDQGTKAWIVATLKTETHSVTILPFFAFTLVHNIGISWNLLAQGGMMRWVLTVFQLAVAAGLVFGIPNWVTGLRSLKQPLSVVIYGLLIGGALGNGLDRLRLGYVVDFIDFSPIFRWVFNIADSAITIGVVLFLYEVFFVQKDAPKTPD
jgi:signal peptidase II